MKTVFRLIIILILALLMTGACNAGKNRVSQEQKDQLKALAANTRERTSRERDSLKNARTDLMQAYSEYILDERKTKPARDKISAAQLNLLNIYLDNEISLRGILNSDQFLFFRELMKRRTREPEVHVLPPSETAMDRLPDKQMLDKLGVPVSSRRQLRQQPESFKAIRNMRRDSELLLGLYANYDLDSNAARKLIVSIHEKQITLLTLHNQRQQAIREALSQDQFQQLQQEIARRMKAREQRRRQIK